jgi:Domain of unknown function (DUF4129)
MPHAVVVLLGASVPPTATGLRPAPGPARAWLERELSRPEYQQSLLDRFLGWLQDLWTVLVDGAQGTSSHSAGAAVLVTVVLLALVAALVGRLRTDPAAPAGVDATLTVSDVSAEEHRARAAEALAAGDPSRALVEAYRALATRAVRRGLVEARPGLTAHELATDLAPRFPEHRDALLGAAGSFDQVFYGEQPVTGAAATAVLALDDALRVARPSSPSEHDNGLPAVPR